MRINGEAIHGSKPLAPYESGHIFFTQSGNGAAKYAFYLSSDEGEVSLPSQVVLKGFEAAPKTKISLLGSKADLKWKAEKGNTIIEIPALVRSKWKGKYAVVFKMVK
ncbi:MAG: hypothetical protein M9904_03135 [Chitinophagaceae bacterium]|nr:hypothetical protein [Chitinophagaceae bacterium]